MLKLAVPSLPDSHCFRHHHRDSDIGASYRHHLVPSNAHKGKDERPRPFLGPRAVSLQFSLPFYSIISTQNDSSTRSSSSYSRLTFL